GQIHDRIKISSEQALTRVLVRDRGAWAELTREQPVQNAAGVDNGLAGDRAPGGAVQLDRSFVNIERAAEQVRRAAGELQSVRAELGPIARSADDAVDDGAVHFTVDCPSPGHCPVSIERQRSGWASIKSQLLEKHHSPVPRDALGEGVEKGRAVADT